MAGPWSGPVVLTRCWETGFRLAAKSGNPQLGQVELRARAADGDIEMEVQTRERAAGLGFHVLQRIGLIRRMQSYTWAEMLENAAHLAGGRQPGRITLTSWKHGMSEEATAIVDGLCEITLETDDRATLETFYRAALALQVLSRDDDRTWLACGPRARLGLWTPGEKNSETKAAATCTSLSPSPRGRSTRSAAASPNSTSATTGRSSTPAATGRSTAKTQPATSSNYGTSSNGAKERSEESPP